MILQGVSKPPCKQNYSYYLLVSTLRGRPTKYDSFFFKNTFTQSTHQHSILLLRLWDGRLSKTHFAFVRHALRKQGQICTDDGSDFRIAARGGAICHHYGMDKKPYLFLLTFPHNLASIKFALAKLCRTKGEICIRRGEIIR